MTVSPIATHEYSDMYGNICTRFTAPRGRLRLWNSTLVQDSGQPDVVVREAREIPPQDLPDDVLRYLLSSRYCEVDLLSTVALDLFGSISPGWDRVEAVCTWINSKVTFGYHLARPTKTALDVFVERGGGLSRLPAPGRNLLPLPQYTPPAT